MGPVTSRTSRQAYSSLTTTAAGTSSNSSFDAAATLDPFGTSGMYDDEDDDNGIGGGGGGGHGPNSSNNNNSNNNDNYNYNYESPGRRREEGRGEEERKEHHHRSSLKPSVTLRSESSRRGRGGRGGRRRNNNKKKNDKRSRGDTWFMGEEGNEEDLAEEEGEFGPELMKRWAAELDDLNAALYAPPLEPGEVAPSTGWALTG